MAQAAKPQRRLQRLVGKGQRSPSATLADRDLYFAVSTYAWAADAIIPGETQLHRTAAGTQAVTALIIIVVRRLVDYINVLNIGLLIIQVRVVFIITVHVGRNIVLLVNVE